MNIITRDRRPVDSPLSLWMKDAQACPAINALTPVLGIDGSLSKLGFCLAQGSRVKAWVWNPKKMGVARLAEIRAEVFRVVQTYGVSHVCLEGYSLGSRTGHPHSTGEGGGVMRLALFDAKTPTLEVSPNSLKKFLSGKGNTPKSGMPLWLFKQYGVTYSNDDEADAAGLAIMGAAFFNMHSKNLFEYQRDALKGTKHIIV